MREVFIVSDNIVSPLGFTSGDNFKKLKEGVSGIRQHDDPSLSAQPVYAALISDEQDRLLTDHFPGPYTKFEKLLLESVKSALNGTDIDVKDKKTVFIVSSTKGNISLIESNDLNGGLTKRLALHASAKLVADYFGFKTRPLVISHACISGLAAIISGMRLLQAGVYDHAVVTGADAITKFVLSGFQSFQAISTEPCAPFDANRKGITLGEGAATVILSIDRPSSGDLIRMDGGAVTNDANHISGPSRTGEELFRAIEQAMKQSDVSARDIDFISAHGTATIYNDEMEAKAIHLAGMQDIPVNSLKGYYGHTLGAAGLIETIMSIHSLRNNAVLPTKGFNEQGTSKPLHVFKTLKTGRFNTCLKTASGFGGCNAAVIFKKAV